jgi:hypothetical protein
MGTNQGEKEQAFGKAQEKFRHREKETGGETASARPPDYHTFDCAGLLFAGEAAEVGAGKARGKTAGR